MNTKRLLIFLLITFFLTFTLSANSKKSLTIDRNLAYDIAQKWISLAGPNIELVPRHVYTHYYNNRQVFYLFSFDGAGFIIIGADKVLPPVIGYSFTGNSNNIDHLINSKFIQSLEHSVVSPVKRNVLEGENKTAWDILTVNSCASWPFSSNKVEPLLTTKWGQKAPYNARCPLDGTQGTLVGCVQVAIGQIMRYHKFPPGGTGRIRYKWSGQFTSKWLEGELGNSIYNWDNMPDVLTGDDSIAVDATATFLYNLGLVAFTGFGIGSSGAHVLSKGYMRSFYGYDFEFVGEETLIPPTLDTLITLLNNSYPILVTGASTVGTGIHAFVIDGIDSTNYLHVNWGWKGSYDGYFSWNSLRPGSYDFTHHKKLSTVFKPDYSMCRPKTFICRPMGNISLWLFSRPVFRKAHSFYRVYKNNTLVCDSLYTDLWYDTTTVSNKDHYNASSVYLSGYESDSVLTQSNLPVTKVSLPAVIDITNGSDNWSLEFHWYKKNNCFRASNNASAASDMKLISPTFHIDSSMNASVLSFVYSLQNKKPDAVPDSLFLDAIKQGDTVFTQLALYTENKVNDTITIPIGTYCGNDVVFQWRYSCGYTDEVWMSGAEQDYASVSNIILSNSVSNYPRYKKSGPPTVAINKYKNKAVITMYLNNKSDVTITVYNVLGQTVYTPLTEKYNKGMHTKHMDFNSKTSSTYIINVQSNAFVYNKKIMIVR